MKRIAITMGDPAGVGPELCLKYLKHAQNCELEFTIYGNRIILEKVSQKLDLSLDGIRIKDHVVKNAEQITPGIVQPNCGRAAYDFLTSAIDDALAGRTDAIVTCPINKAALEAAGIHYPGHTEILVDRTNSSNHAMMLSGPDLSCSLVTTHIGIAEVPKVITYDRIIEVATLSAQVMEQRHQRPVRLAVLGLNPHAGEGGLFGKEEIDIIQPAIETLRSSGIDVIGPLPPDTAFLPQIRKEVDAYVCMYHDQGLIPLKTLNFDDGVNVTLGLPIIRTSVDHGTAFDIAWQGIASTQSLECAIAFAASL